LFVLVSSGFGYSLARISGELEDTKATLVITQTNLTSTQNDLKDTQNTLTSTQSDLQSTKDTLTTTQNTLETTQDTLTSARTDLKNSIIRLGRSQVQIDDYSQQLADIQLQFDNLSKGYSSVTNNVSYKAVMTFIAKDRTDTNTYDTIKYNCFNYSADVISNAINQHIRCGFVYIMFKEPHSAHAIIAFSTTDRGIIYIEPQTDNVVNPQVGKHYWKECQPQGVFYAPTTYDDTIESFVIIW
jgi:hypothetical protein